MTTNEGEFWRKYLNDDEASSRAYRIGELSKDFYRHLDKNELAKATAVLELITMITSDMIENFVKDLRFAIDEAAMGKKIT